MYMKVKKIKFSHNLAKGSCLQRKLKSNILNDLLFQDLIGLYENNKYVSVKKLEKFYNQFMPESVNLFIKKNPAKDDTNAECCILYVNKIANRYEIFLPAIKNKLFYYRLPTLVHETTHLFDALLNPKHIKVDQYLLKNGILDITEDFYQQNYYSIKSLTLFTLKAITKKAISKLSYKGKLSVLNYIKDGIQAEKHAYSEEKRIALWMKEINPDRKLAYNSSVDFYNFDEKLQLVNQMILETIQKERYKSKLKDTKNLGDKVKLSLNYYFRKKIN